MNISGRKFYKNEISFVGIKTFIKFEHFGSNKQYTNFSTNNLNNISTYEDVHKFIVICLMYSGMKIDVKTDR